MKLNNSLIKKLINGEKINLINFKIIDFDGTPLRKDLLHLTYQKYTDGIPDYEFIHKKIGIGSAFSTYLIEIPNGHRLVLEHIGLKQVVTWSQSEGVKHAHKWLKDLDNAYFNSLQPLQINCARVWRSLSA